MSHSGIVSTRDPEVGLYVEEVGSGPPILFIHEFAGDYRSWQPQTEHFASRHRCITYSARGYFPSSVPSDPAAYSQEKALEDAIDVLDALSIDRAHVVGLSMGGFCALHLGMWAKERVISVTACGVGYGSEPDKQSTWQQECGELADLFVGAGAPHAARLYAAGPTRTQLRDSDPAGYQAFIDRLSEHSAVGSALTMRGVQMQRTSLFEIQEELRALDRPLMVVVGERDQPALEASYMLGRVVAGCRLEVCPGGGHTVNLEEPDRFNQLLEEFLRQAPA